jgi:hypothetical protein
MACPNCGAAVKPDAKFCGSCGSKLSSSNSGNTSYPTIVISTPSPLGLPPCQFKLIETKGEGPDDDGDVRIELKYSVINNTDQNWDYFAITTQLVNFDGQVIEQSTDSFEQTLDPEDETELDVYFGAANLKLLGQHPEKSVIVSTITACKAEFVSLGSIDIPAEAFQVTSIQPTTLGQSAQLLSGSVYKTEPDSDKDCQVQVKALIQNLTKLPLHEVKIIADVTDKSGRELCDAGGYEQIRPDEICLIQGNGYTKEKTLKSAKVELSLRCYAPVAVSTVQTNGLDLSESESESENHSDYIDDDDENTDNLHESWPQADTKFNVPKLTEKIIQGIANGNLPNGTGLDIKRFIESDSDGNFSSAVIYLEEWDDEKTTCRQRGACYGYAGGGEYDGSFFIIDHENDDNRVLDYSEIEEDGNYQIFNALMFECGRMYEEIDGTYELTEYAASLLKIGESTRDGKVFMDDQFDGDSLSQVSEIWPINLKFSS